MIEKKELPKRFEVDNSGKKNTIKNPIYLFGDNYIEKTFTLKEIENYFSNNKSIVLCITGKDFINDVMELSEEELNSKYENIDVLLFDDVDSLERHNRVQRYLLKIFDLMYDNNKQMIFCSKKKVSSLIIDERLKMRLYWGITIPIYDTPIIDEGNELKELYKFLNIGKPILITPTMDYHKTLWGLTFTNSLLNDNKKVRYFSLYETKDNMLEMIDKYHWRLKRDVLESSEAKGTFVDDKKDIDDIVRIINEDKPDVAIIDHYTNEELCSGKDFQDILTELTNASMNNNTAIVIIGGVSNSTNENNLKEKSKEEKEEVRKIVENGFNKIVSLKPVNMVEISEITI